ncbi:hypothetical protein D9756_009189 [Leucocoprinus leucothites]|uniref:Nephrocystin 3-like N-terminal domain-containing protein n=1 Tax=Leucocoprinus leucothites TaxID=201217 RepID=A0A8H5D0H8_9AGAR|nr:hypothetical protein D9756_009189 [Leucoagaricus leucothites]
MSLFQGSHNFKASGTFVDGPLTVNIHNAEASNSASKISPGIDALLRASTPQAIHDSSARSHAQCFPGTREEHIRNITSWGKGEWGTNNARILWLHGPAGVGKSALAQSCVGGIGDKVVGTFFFSRPNQWNHPMSVFPTVAYQLATCHEGYRDIVNAIILRDPLVLEKSIPIQFRELLVKPLAQLGASQRQILENSIIILDGLDECDGLDAQCTIIETVVNSIHQHTTPFLWTFFSRRESHIESSFSSELASQITLQLTLPVSRDADKDIEAYIRDGFRLIRAKYNLPPAISWPTEKAIQQIVDQSGGLFIYAASVIRYVYQNNGAFGPEAQLQVVLDLGNNQGNRPTNPLASLDSFYHLIMKQIPRDILPTTLAILCIHSHQIWGRADDALIYCSVLSLSPSAFYAAMNNLSSVLEVNKSLDGMPIGFSYYHASFGEFLTDVGRSTSEFCINMPDVHNRCFAASAKLLRSLSCLDNDTQLAEVLPWQPLKSSSDIIFAIAVLSLFIFEQKALDMSVLEDLSKINWNNIAEPSPSVGWGIPGELIQGFRRSVCTR